MQVKIDEKVSVNLSFNHLNGEVFPHYLKWKNKVYTIQKIGLHYTIYRGRKLFHMFSVSNNQSCFLLSLDTENLHWTLEEVADNQVN